MNKILPALIAVIVLTANSIHAQTWGDSLSLDLEATAQVSPPQITLTWSADADASSFSVYRKLKGASSWGAVLATVSSASTSYADATAVVGTQYDYRVTMNSSTTPVKYGYCASGINVQANSNRGIALVVIENSYLSNSAFQTAVDQTLMDLELDGWYTKTIYVTSTDAVATVKSGIVTKYNEDPAKTKLLLLLGHVPVPHSGALNPDGHSDHIGAWPADMFYGDMNGTWTDATVNVVSSSNTRNHNTPGDGKYDQDYIPSDIELQVGRVDLAELPSFTETEEMLLLRYMDKLHRFKTAQIQVQDRGLIDDNFTSYSEGFSQNGYKNFSPLVGRANITTANDYFTELSYTTGTTGTYLWSYGCGGGWYAGAGGIGSTANFPPDTLSTVFTMLFGSYFGDWDYSDAFLRAPLAQGNTLTNCWAGRPNWHFYTMAMGENIGYSARLTQNNTSLYFGSTIGGLARMITINLMGDPALRMHYIEQPGSLNIAAGGTSNTLTWTASAGGSEIGYNVYRRYTDSTDFVKLNSSLITGTSFSDMTLPVAGTVYYYVKAVELKTTPSGAYYNESLAVRDSAQVTVGMTETPGMDVAVYPNPSKGNITVQFNGVGANATISVVNAIGETVYVRPGVNTTLNEISLDVNAGVYFVRVNTNNGTLTKKVVIER
ncbi:MAG TPA: T9SS type A sorting domain-containing protein [Flavobacteriales bacterium]|nr:T9SS type A sorting domain-containing protein [Flavobacteriales bacterium]